MIIRAATDADATAIGSVVTAAFGRADESAMVEGVRAAKETLVELVAAEGGEITGHVLFSRVTGNPAMVLAALAPLAVSPSHQGRGVGSALVRRGLQACARLGAKGCVVLGAPAYYGRFGFSTAGANLRCRYSGLPAFQSLEFEAGALAGPLTLAYPAAFD